MRAASGLPSLLTSWASMSSPELQGTSGRERSRKGLGER